MAKGKLQAVRGKNTIVLVLDGETINLQEKQHPELFAKVDKMVKANDISALEAQFASIKKRVENYTKGVFTVVNGKVMLKGNNVPMPKAIVKKLLELEKGGDDFMPLLRFWRKLKENPSTNSREQLYSFMMANKMSITEQGDIVFEKGVKRKHGGLPDQLVDVYTGRVDHSIGMIVEMPRNKVNDDPQQTCSHGIHCAPPEYVRDFYGSGVIIECIVNPKDVVSVPVDYNNRKVRVCRLQVMGFAGKTPRVDQVIKLSDFLENMPEHYKGTPTEKPKSTPETEGTKTIHPTHKVSGEGKNITITTTDAEKEIKGKTAKEIVDYVKQKTDIKININIKNKNSIIKKAIEILTKFNEEDTMRMENEAKELGSADIAVVEGKTAKQIVAYIKKTYDMDLSHINVKNKRKIIKEAEAIIEHQHVAKSASEVEDTTGEFTPDSKDVEESTQSEGAIGPHSQPVDNATDSEEPEKVIKSIHLSEMLREDMIKLVRSKFNEKIGGLLVSEKKVRDRATKIFKEAGYEVH